MNEIGSSDDQVSIEEAYDEKGERHGLKGDVEGSDAL